MKLRFSPAWTALVVVLVAALAYSAGAQSVAFPTPHRLVVKAVPEGRDIRSFFAAPASPTATSLPPVDVFAVPAGKVFVVADVIVASVGSYPYGVRLRENGAGGSLRTEFFVPTPGWSRNLSSGLPYDGGTTVTVQIFAASATSIPYPVTISGYLADA